MNTVSLREFLNSRNFFADSSVVEILERKLKSNRKAFLLKGPAGVGKTTLASLIAEYLNAEIVFYQCTSGTSEDDLLYKYVPSEETKSGIRLTIGPIPYALKLSQLRPVVLILDEFDKTRPSADALLLDVLQNFRVSLYLNDEERVVTGNPENLIVFLTSNDFREFSEPLLRRLTVITLKPLPPIAVYKMLRSKFDEKVAILLTQIYDDTIKANLRKQATIQELLELGELLTEGVSASLEELLRMFIIKYDDDWQKYIEYIKNRKPYKFETYKFENKNEDILINAYTPEDEIMLPLPMSHQGKSNVITILEKIVVKSVQPEPVNPERINREIEVTAKIIDHDFEGYTKIIQALNPEPSERPDIIGIFRMVIEGNSKYLITEKPLTFDELSNIINNNINGEYYAEDYVILTKNDFHDVIMSADRIKYYTRDTIFIEDKSDGQVVDRIKIERVDEEGNMILLKVSLYLNFSDNTSVSNTLNKLLKHYSFTEFDDTINDAIKLVRKTSIKQYTNISYKHYISSKDLSYILDKLRGVIESFNVVKMDWPMIRIEVRRGEIIANIWDDAFRNSQGKVYRFEEIENILRKAYGR